MSFIRNSIFNQTPVSSYGTFTEENTVGSIDLENPQRIESKHIESPKRSFPQFSCSRGLMAALFLFLLGMISIILFRSDSDKDNFAFNEHNDEFFHSLNISDILKGIEDGVDNVCQIRQSICDGNLGIPRGLMPQLSPDVLMNYIAMKIWEGHDVISTRISPELLIPVQNEISAERILHLLRKAAKNNPCDHNALVALGNWIVDGHHHVIACRFFGGKLGKQKITLIRDTLEHIWTQLQNFKGVTHNNLMRSP